MPTIKVAIAEFPGYYIDKNADVWSARRTKNKPYGRGFVTYLSNDLKKLKAINHNGGYLCVKLRKDGKYHDKLLHRLMLEVFVGPCPDGMECCHRDSNKHNNVLSNLRWDTRQGNVSDMVANGTSRCATEAARLVNTGKERSQEFKNKISAAKTGVPLTEDHKAAITEAHWSNREDAAEIIERSAAKHRGKKHSEEHKAKIAEAGRRRWAKIREERSK